MPERLAVLQFTKKENTMDKNTARELLVRVLDDMEKKALEMKIQGVGVACFLDEGCEVDWIGGKGGLLGEGYF